MRGAEIGTARDTLVRAFVDDLAFGWPDPAHPYHTNPHVLVAIEATVELHRPIAVPRLVIAIQKLAKSGVADAVQFAGSMALRVREAGEQVDEATKAVLRIWLVQEKTDDKGNAIKRALQVAWWRDAALEALETLTAKQLGGVTDPPAELVTRAAQLYATATNWGDANELAADVANPLADRFSPADIAFVFEKAHNGADLIGSHGFREFTRLLYDKNPIADPELERLMDEHHLEHYKRADQVEEA